MRFEAGKESEEGLSTNNVIQHNRYGKLLRRSMTKKLQELYFQFNSFVFTMSGSNSSAICILRTLCILQMALSSFIPLNTELWAPGSLPAKMLNILSFFVYIIPGSVSPAGFLQASIVLSIIFFLLFVVYFYSIFSYSRDSKLQSSLIAFCSIFQTSSVTYISLVCFGFFTKALLFYTTGEIGILSIIPIIFSIITVLLCLVTYSMSTAIFLAMRPSVTSMMSMRFSFVYNFFECLSYGALLLAGYSGTTLTIVFACIALVLTAANTYITFNNIVWNNSTTQNLHKSVNITNMVILFVIIIQTLTKTNLSEIHLVVYCILLGIFYVIFTSLTKKGMASKMALLDQLEQEGSLDDHENMKPKEMVELLSIGFFQGHPFAHSWTGFDLALNKWPEDRNLIILLLRCTSIYPDESQRLRDALIRAVSIKKGDYEVKKLIADGQALLQQRERNLSKNLKKQLNKIKEKSDKCIGHIRHIFECIIRGSVAELEPLSAQLKKMEDEVTKDYNQLLSIFSNNPYVVRAYATFLTDVACDQVEGSRYMHMYKTLRAGSRVLNEKSYFFALKGFSSLPTEEFHSQIIQQKSIEEMTNDLLQQEKSVQSFTIGASEQQWGEDDSEINNADYVESLVNTVHLPSIKKTKIFFVVLFILVAIATSVPFVFVFNQRMSTSVDAYTLIHTISLAFTHFLDATLLALHVVLNANGLSDSLKDRYIAIKGSTEGMPEAWENDSEVLRSKIQGTRSWNEKVEAVLPSLKESGYFSRAISHMFNQEYTYKYYKKPGIFALNYYNAVNASYQQLSTFYLEALTSALNDPLNSINEADFFTVTHNSVNLISISKDLFGDVIVEFGEMLTSTTKFIDVLLLVVGVVVMVLALSFIIYIVYENRREMTLIYSSFKAIPKSTISTIIQKLNASINKNIDESETENLSIQEENALRLLSTSSTQNIINGSFIIYFVIPILIFYIGYITIITLMYDVPLDIYSSMEKIPHALRNLIAVPSYLENAIIYAFRLCLSNDATYKASHPDSSLILAAVYQNFLQMYPTLLSDIWIGADKDGNGLGVLGDVHGILSTSNCKPSDMTTEMGLIGCGSFEMGTQTAYQNIVRLFQKGTIASVNDIETTVLLYYMEYMCIDNVILPSYELSQKTMDSMTTRLSSSMTIPCIVILVVIVLIGLFALSGIDEIGGHSVWSLRLLLFCPQQVILNSKPILKILSNDFSNSEDDSISSGASFYETLVSHLLNGTLFLDNQLTIKSANSAVQNILGLNNEDILGKNLHDILKAPSGKEAGLHAFFTAVDGAMTSLRSPDIECEADILKGGETMTVQFNLIAVSITGEVQTRPTNAEGIALIALVMKDMTATIAARTLLREEHDKGEHLLSMILPQIIVQKLQKGESNISFSVQSASVIFMDIVSFTPWCGSLPAADVMKTLNKLFAVLDSNVNRYDRMIKIKCIGDCYMAAGGIFDEVNQPAEHCKQAISFCLDAISALELFDIENHLSLRIRAGINCGGPIIAGVLGIEKPTFDILGPAISVAAMMEHNGVPMNVHIPQHMYELVYDQPFVFKERGDIEIKGKPMHTYLVTGYA